MSFFIRGNDDTFYPIGTYNRITAIYELLNESGFGAWEKINPVSMDMIRIAYNTIDGVIVGLKHQIASLKEDRDKVASFNNSIDDKRYALENYRAIIEDYEEELEEVEEVKSFCWFLQQIIEDRSYVDGADPNKYLYCGIEIGCPTIDDIIE